MQTTRPGPVHAQEFSAGWPGVLDDMLEFITLAQLALGRGRAPQVLVSLSRQRVSAEQLQPHVNGFRERLLQQWPAAQLTLAAGTGSAHRVEVRFGG
ncbi:hypothetical protein JI739_03270 [Ramlibacter sp. AW1]|uniref:Uncharacterized protein n=1 Tax=Ramlibacter aurantiacus TaxID=2801330 RepID=A0A937D624_9BURK|nr:hypothetical protein [Ramlibacter aurantiacus]MBL0419361.1 hypothetical protein [Ramlibacter aurantiacus]